MFQTQTREVLNSVSILYRDASIPMRITPKKCLCFSVRARSRVLRRVTYVSCVHHNTTEESTHSSTRSSPSALPTPKWQVAQFNWAFSQARIFAQQAIKLERVRLLSAAVLSCASQVPAGVQLPLCTQHAYLKSPGIPAQW